MEIVIDNLSKGHGKKVQVHLMADNRQGRYWIIWRYKSDYFDDTA